MKKIKLQIKGMTFQLPINSLRDENSSNPYIYMGAKNTASIIKQYVKQKYGNEITVWSTSEVYSGGSSVRVNIWSKDGTKPSETIYSDIKEFSNLFQAGHFDGMYDIYEYRDDKVMTDNNTHLKYFPSYIFVDNKPKWGSIEYWLNEWNTFDESNYHTSCEFQGNTKWERFMNFNRWHFGKGIEVKLNSYNKKESIELNYDLEGVGV